MTEFIKIKRSDVPLTKFVTGTVVTPFVIRWTDPDGRMQVRVIGG